MGHLLWLQAAVYLYIHVASCGCIEGGVRYIVGGGGKVDGRGIRGEDSWERGGAVGGKR